MRRLSDTDRKTAMERLYGEFYEPLFLFAVTYLDSDDEARDVVSDVFETVWQRWQKEPSAAPMATSAWLYTLTRNRCIDLLRHDRSRRSYAELMERTEQFDTSADVADYEQSLSRVRRAVSQLPEPGRTILECCYFRRMTYQEAADHLELSLVSVRKQMLKVFRTLREMLNNHNRQV